MSLVSPIGLSYGIAYRAAKSAEFWLSLLLACVILLLPVMINRFFWFDTRPSYADRLRVQAKIPRPKPPKPEDGHPAKPPSMARTAPTRRSRRGSLRSGYAFSHSQGFGELIAKGTLFRNLEQLRIPSLRRESLTRTRFPASSGAAGGGLGHTGGQLLAPIEEVSTPKLSTVSMPGAHLPSERVENERQTAAESPPDTFSKVKFINPLQSIYFQIPNQMQLQTTRGEPSGIPLANSPPPTHSRSRGLGTTIARAISPRGPSPSFDATQHNMVVNMDEEEGLPLPSDWQMNADGTMRIPELEGPTKPGSRKPPLPTTSNPVGSGYTEPTRSSTSASRRTATTFTSKKARNSESAIGRRVSNSSSTSTSTSIPTHPAACSTRTRAFHGRVDESIDEETSVGEGECEGGIDLTSRGWDAGAEEESGPKGRKDERRGSNSSTFIGKRGSKKRKSQSDTGRRAKGGVGSRRGSGETNV